MFWSQQFLSFAGVSTYFPAALLSKVMANTFFFFFFIQYELPTGEILGDPAQKRLTKDIIALGWKPPTPKTRWDILPLVVMAEGDEPLIAILPPEFTELVLISHPHYPKIADLDLKWSRFPALSRLGFDLGGVQYTASPFVGWFMDAEIGVRNLADPFRYNVLPEMAETIGWSSPNHTFDDLPDHERLLWLSKAQAELNYAVYFSFQKAGVTCTSSLTASQSWTMFDDQHLREKGYRLNADPYWISPPQGSIVPLWHRGGAPNYQPKPLIARHKFDPVKAWKRRSKALTPAEAQLNWETTADTFEDIPATALSKVHIFYCGTSGTAANLAEKLRILVRKKWSKAAGEFGTLNSLDVDRMHPDDTVLLIVATTGKGEIPSNGQQCFKKMRNLELTLPSIRFSIFGIGDSGYYKTFNWACKYVQRGLEERNLRPLMLDCVVESDVAAENPPWTDFRAWWDRVERVLNGKVGDDKLQHGKKQETSTLYEKQCNIIKDYREATIRFDPLSHQAGRILKLSLEILESWYEPMGHIRLLPQNSEAAVQKAIEMLGINEDQTIGTVSAKGVADRANVLDEQLLAIPMRRFLSDYVDLHSPFMSMDWAQNLSSVKNESAFQVLEDLSQSLKRLSPRISLEKLLFSMTPLRPRSYSIASSLENRSNSDIDYRNATLDILVHVIPNGRFSQRCLAGIGDGGKILYKLTTNNICAPLLNLSGRPLIAVVSGTGIAPVRSLLQHLIHTDTESKISLFIGFKPDNNTTKLFDEIVQQASKKGILDILYVVPSNVEKVRVQDHFDDCEETLRRKIGDEGGYFYACGNAAVVRGAKEKLKKILGPQIWSRGRQRILEETF
jgi:nitric oxide synthase oxygenase domain/subunit/sulfite reductase alpha subunit-like flavoprotein